MHDGDTTQPDRHAADGPWLSAAAAAERLGVSRATLYAYVSRGMLRSEPVADGPGAARGRSRARRYLAGDVAQLLERTRVRRDPAALAEATLAWGTPVRASAITLIADGALFYRGRSVADLARRASIEEVIALLWEAPLGEAGAAAGVTTTPLDDAPALPLHRLHALLPLLPASPQLVDWDLQPESLRAVAQAAFTRLASTTAGATWRGEPLAAFLLQHLRDASAGGVGGDLTDAQAERLLTAALIAAADHELNASSFTVRCVASTGAPLTAAISAGIAAMLGPRHGGALLRVEALLADVRSAGGDAAAAAQVCARWMQRGDGLPGFGGHHLYPTGDPRAVVLRDLLLEAACLPPEVAALMVATANLPGSAPNIDVALVAVARALHLQPTAALALMLLARSIGWVAHALEEYATGEIIRPRARYTGPQPGIIDTE